MSRAEHHLLLIASRSLITAVIMTFTVMLAAANDNVISYVLKLVYPPSPDMAIILGVYFPMLVAASFCVYVGSWMSTMTTVQEAMSSKDAYMFPVIGSVVLFSLYVLFRFLNKDYVNLILSVYFFFIGTIAVYSIARQLLSRMTLLLPYSVTKGTRLTTFKIPCCRIPFIREDSGPIILQVTKLDIYAFVVGLFVSIAYVVSGKHWVANNIIGMSFSINAIELISVGSVQIGCTLLIGLFFYDIFWVFGTDVMVTVAKSFDAPIKLLFPKSLFGMGTGFSMLGLGDIVIPGIFVAILLRFDASRSANRFFRPTYFHSAFFGYVLGLATTMFVMHVFKAAQPALLYLVPSCISCVFLVAYLNGDVSEVLAYTESPVEAKNITDDVTNTSATSTKPNKKRAIKK